MVTCKKCDILINETLQLQIPRSPDHRWCRMHKTSVQDLNGKGSLKSMQRETMTKSIDTKVRLPKITVWSAATYGCEGRSRTLKESDSSSVLTAISRWTCWWLVEKYIFFRPNLYLTLSSRIMVSELCTAVYCSGN